MNEQEKAARQMLLSRRGFFQGAVLLAGAATLAGCGGGGGSKSPGERYNGTYRSNSTFSDSSQVAASVSIDRNGILTFWSILTNVNSPLLDYGQVIVNDDGTFGQSIGGIRTYGTVYGDRISGRTEYTSDSTGFGWDVYRYQPGGSHPSSDRIGTFYGDNTINGIEYTTFLTVAPDGTATFFGAFDNPNTSGVDYYDFDSMHFDSNGNVPSDNDYLLFLYGDRMALTSGGSSTVRLEFTFGQDASGIGISAGDRVDFVLTDVTSRSIKTTRSVIQRSAITDAKADMAANAPAIRRAISAMRKP